MKDLVKFEQDIGGDGAHAKVALGVDGSNLAVAVQASYPIAKIVDPVMSVVDSLIDKIEGFIPGDQKPLADQLKLEAREELVKLLSESK